MEFGMVNNHGVSVCWVHMVMGVVLSVIGNAINIHTPLVYTQGSDQGGSRTNPRRFTILSLRGSVTRNNQICHSKAALKVECLYIQSRDAPIPKRRSRCVMHKS
jgi:hypothetical protein